MIGQIVNCPKCNSMIQIEEPRQIRVESHRGVIDSTAMTKEAFAPELEEEYRLQTVESEAFQSMQEEQPLVAPPRAEDYPALAAAPLQSPPVASPKPTANSAHEIQRLAVQRTARNRQVLMVAVLGTSGVLVAGILFTAFLYWYSAKPKKDLAQNPDQGAQVTPGPKREPEPPQMGIDDPTEGAEPQEPSSETKTDSGSGNTSAVPNEASSPLSGNEEPSVDPAQPNGSSVDKTTADKQPNEGDGVDLATALSTQMAKENQAAPKNGTDTPESPTANAANNSTASNDPPSKDPAKADEASKGPAGNASELPEQLKKFESILSQSIEPQLLPDAVVQQAPPTAEELGLPTGVNAKAIAPIDVAERMQIELAGLILPEKSPFSVVVLQWVSISGIPTVVDLDSFVAAGIDPRRTLGVKLATKQSMADVGNLIAKQMGAELNSIGNQFLAFQASETKIKGQLPTSIKVSDLVSNVEQEQW